MRSNNGTLLQGFELGNGGMGATSPHTVTDEQTIMECKDEQTITCKDKDGNIVDTGTGLAGARYAIGVNVATIEFTGTVNIG